ncbi:60S ribosomal protein L19-3 [Hibiscus syriacus]|uniref:60S ribosomal protein L19-3 n=1 Tax=Hibiscus syriacus TaxID=106335 RepID=A0A6A2ZVX8_HIBSY|nr:60S ribosomal protein L19-3 [Hibiscus syriacus]
MGYPCVSAALGLVYIVSHYLYFTGYATGDPKNRLTREIWVLGIVGAHDLHRFVWDQSASTMIMDFA